VVEVPLGRARLAGNAREPWVAYDCPVCSAVEGVAVAGQIADELRRHGLEPADTGLAIEVLEPHPAGEFDELSIAEFLTDLDREDDLVGVLLEETFGDG
jgi:hypothetical protein